MELSILPMENLKTGHCVKSANGIFTPGNAANGIIDPVNGNINPANEKT